MSCKFFRLELDCNSSFEEDEFNCPGSGELLCEKVGDACWKI